DTIQNKYSCFLLFHKLENRLFQSAITRKPKINDGIRKRTSHDIGPGQAWTCSTSALRNGGAINDNRFRFTLADEIHFVGSITSDFNPFHNILQEQIQVLDPRIGLAHIRETILNSVLKGIASESPTPDTLRLMLVIQIYPPDTDGRHMWHTMSA